VPGSIYAKSVCIESSVIMMAIAITIGMLCAEP
jgi:hypothetical protein